MDNGRDIYRLIRIRITFNIRPEHQPNEDMESIKSESSSKLAEGECKHNDNSSGAEQFGQLIIEELKNITSQTIEIKELIKESAERASVKSSESPTRKPEAVKISPTYFSENQINLLNAELRQIAEKYKAANMFPIIEVVPGPVEEHPVMEQLRRGVSFQPTAASDSYERLYIQLGVGGFKRSLVKELLTEYPDLKLGNLVEAVLRSNNEWKDLSNKYYWHIAN